MYRFFLGLSRYMAIAGGAVLLAVIILTCVSILGREVNSMLHADWVEAAIPGPSDWLLHEFGVGEVKGSFEITESAMAFVIFAFMPLTQITAGHASVDVFTNFLSERINSVLRMIAETLFAVALTVIAVQLFSGMLTKLDNSETTLFLQYPVWWGYAASMIGAITAAVVSIYLAAMRIYETFSGHPVLPPDQGEEY